MNELFLKDRMIAIPNSRFSTVIRVRISLRCNQCGYEWGTNLTYDWQVGIGFDKCHKCGASQTKDLDENSDLVDLKGKGA